MTVWSLQGFLLRGGEEEGLHASEFVNSFDFWCKRGEFTEFSYVHLSNCSLIVLSYSNRSYSHWKKINTLVFSDKFILNNLLTRKDIFWRP